MVRVLSKLSTGVSVPCLENSLDRGRLGESKVQQEYHKQSGELGS